MQFVAVQLNLFVYIAHNAVYPHSHKAFFAHVFKHILAMALLVFDDRRENLGSCACGQSRDLIHNILRGLADQRQPL